MGGGQCHESAGGSCAYELGLTIPPSKKNPVEAGVTGHDSDYDRDGNFRISAL
jgi:hypothetical protein